MLANLDVGSAIKLLVERGTHEAMLVPRVYGCSPRLTVEHDPHPIQVLKTNAACLPCWCPTCKPPSQSAPYILVLPTCSTQEMGNTLNPIHHYSIAHMCPPLPPSPVMYPPSTSILYHLSSIIYRPSFILHPPTNHVLSSVALLEVLLRYTYLTAVFGKSKLKSYPQIISVAGPLVASIHQLLA